MEWEKVDDGIELLRINRGVFFVESGNSFEE